MPKNTTDPLYYARVDRVQAALPVLARLKYLDGEYGHSDVSIGVPAVIGKNGVEKINELDLNQEEKEWFDKGVNSVKNALSSTDI